MTLGRNEPCPCGSGKKYKKCCLAKDEEAARKAKPAPAPASVPTSKLEPARDEPPPNPQMDAWNARWDEFDAADYEGRMALFLRTLEEEELMDAEMEIGGAHV